jgi:nicotinamidase-related amidase
VLLRDLTKFQQVVLEKQVFDFSTNGNCQPLLAQLRPSRIMLYGVATIICVAAAARSLLARLYSVSSVLDATAELAFTTREPPLALKNRF